MKIRKRNFKKNGESQNFWPSFADVMSTIALVLFFLMLLAYIQNIITGKNLEFHKKQLEDTKKNLDASRLEISQAEKELRLLQDEIEKTKAEVERGRKELKLSQREIEKQKKIIAESNEELGKLRTKLQDVAVLRVNVLESVKESIEEELGERNEKGEQLVSIGKNANIIINERLVFDYNSYNIKTEGKALITQLAIAFERILDNDEIRKNIDAINIEGHTDITGTADYNRELSTKRATTVVNYMMESNPDLKNKYGKYFAATGYSEFRPIALGNTEEAHRKNRRIEISIIIKDSNVQKIIEDYLEE